MRRELRRGGDRQADVELRHVLRLLAVPVIPMAFGAASMKHVSVWERAG